MSDAVRSYRRGSLPAAKPTTPPRFGFLKNAAKITAFVVVMLAVYAFVTTRDTQPIHHFISATNTYHVNVYDFINRRSDWASSPMWKSLPEEWIDRDIPQHLQKNHGFPDWMVRNFAGRLIHITGNDISDFSDAVFITRMTSIGNLLERMMHWTPRFKSDDAGGLDLHYIEDDEVYYAVRGRTLVLSANRDAVIRALTLDPSRRIDTTPPTFSQDKPLLTAQLTPSAKDGPFAAFSTMKIDFYHEALTWNAAIEGTLTDDSKGIWEPLVHTKTGTSLYIPADGSAVLSLNTGSSLRDLWPALGSFFPGDLFTEQQWHSWEQADSDNSYASILTDITGHMGSQIAVSWNGFDLTAQTPAPIVTTILSHDRVLLDSQLEKLPAENPGEEFMAAYVQYDREQKRAYFFGKGGPAWTPTLQPSDSYSVLTSGIYPFDADIGGTLQGDNNLYFSIKPNAATENIIEAGTALSEYGMLEEVTPAEFKRNAARWREKAGYLDAISLIGNYDTGQLNVTIQIQAATP